MSDGGGSTVAGVTPRTVATISWNSRARAKTRNGARRHRATASGASRRCARRRDGRRRHVMTHRVIRRPAATPNRCARKSMPRKSSSSAGARDAARPEERQRHVRDAANRDDRFSISSSVAIPVERMIGFLSPPVASAAECPRSRTTPLCRPAPRSSSETRRRGIGRRREWAGGGYVSAKARDANPTASRLARRTAVHRLRRPCRARS